MEAKGKEQIDYMLPKIPRGRLSGKLVHDRNGVRYYRERQPV